MAQTRVPNENEAVQLSGGALIPVSSVYDQSDGLALILGRNPTGYYHCKYTSDITLAAGLVANWNPHCWDGLVVPVQGDGRLVQVAPANQPPFVAAGWGAGRAAITAVAATQQFLRNTAIGNLFTNAIPFWAVFAVNCPAGAVADTLFGVYDGPAVNNPSLRIQTHSTVAANVAVVTETTTPDGAAAYGVRSIVGVVASAGFVTLCQLTDAGGMVTIVNNQVHLLSVATVGDMTLFCALTGAGVVPAEFWTGALRAFALGVNQTPTVAQLQAVMTHFRDRLDCPLA